MENMNGRELVEGGDLCERRNGNVAYIDSLAMSMVSWMSKMPKLVFFGR